MKMSKTRNIKEICLSIVIIIRSVILENRKKENICNKDFNISYSSSDQRKGLNLNDFIFDKARIPDALIQE